MEYISFKTLLERRNRLLLLAACLPSLPATPAAKAEVQAEPEHWVLEHNDPSREFDYTGVKAKAMDWIRIGLNPTPLYPAPQASKPVPLTHEQLVGLYCEMYGHDPEPIDEFADVCRRVEAAHGIGASND